MFVLEKLFHIDNLSLVMTGLVGFVALCVSSFAYRYLKGDSKQSSFYINLIAMTFSVTLMVSADHLLLLLLSSAASNIFITRMMMHKKEWKAARKSSFLALRNFGFGFLAMSCAFLILYNQTHETSIQAIITTPIEKQWLILSCVFILLSVMTQSALWPFHHWLTSSLNSPTPVSAMMHAGIINGGGFLLARFAPKIAEQEVILSIIFIVGMITVIIGTSWKLIQSDIKRMLACSTMAQMGFMIVQCGLGLFPAAIAHLCWHGLFKAYLFFASGSAAQEKRVDLDYPPSIKEFSLAMFCGIIGAYIFAYMSDENLFIYNTNLFLTIIAAIAGTQLALTIIRGASFVKIILALVSTSSFGALYGISVSMIENILDPIGILYSQSINIIHIIGLIILASGWLGILFFSKISKKTLPDWILKIYVLTLNASQPHPQTVTAHRNHYKF